MLPLETGAIKNFRFKRFNPAPTCGQASRRCQPRLSSASVGSGTFLTLAERNTARPHLFHRRLVLAAPGVGEGGPIELMTERRKQPLRLARDARAPIDERAEDIEEKRFHRRPCQFFCFIELR